MVALFLCLILRRFNVTTAAYQYIYIFSPAFLYLRTYFLRRFSDVFISMYIFSPTFLYRSSWRGSEPILETKKKPPEGGPSELCSRHYCR